MRRHFFVGLVTFCAVVSFLITIICFVALVIGADFPVDVWKILAFSVPGTLVCIYLMIRYKIAVGDLFVWLFSL